MEFCIGEKLKSIRTIRNLSLDETAVLTGVSKPMLGQIERGQSTPTITTLWKIATGLKTPLSLFLDDKQTEYQIADCGDKDPVTEDSGRMKAYPLFVFDPLRSVETFYIEFSPSCKHVSDKHTDGVEEYIFVIRGKLLLVINGEKVTLEERQAIRFRADVAHEYNNPFSEICTVYNTIFYPKGAI